LGAKKKKNLMIKKEWEKKCRYVFHEKIRAKKNAESQLLDKLFL